MAKPVAMIVAGGSGMGADTARRLSQEGYEVAIMSSSGKGEKLAEELSGLGVTGSNLLADDLEMFVESTLAKWGRIDILVNSGGHGPKGDVLDISDDDWTLAMQYYLLNVIRTVRLVVPVMKKQGAGSIVNISSFAAYEPDAAFPTSAVFRAGLGSYVKLVADNVADTGIRINNVLPGFINSFDGEETKANQVPMQRYGRMEEISDLILFLASNKSSYITGQNLVIDGGLTKHV